jgi:hypothetical protein
MFSSLFRDFRPKASNADWPPAHLIHESSVITLKWDSRWDIRYIAYATTVTMVIRCVVGCRDITIWQ